MKSALDLAAASDVVVMALAVLDLKTFEVTGHIDVGGEPDGLAWAIRPDGR